MPKRKAYKLEAQEAKNEGRRRSMRRRSSAPGNNTPAENEDVKSEETSAKKTLEVRENGTGGTTAKTSERTSKMKASKSANVAPDTTNSDSGGSTGTSEEKTYWLLKAEPETRLENGTDVRFSIDDLASKTSPEPWDGIRNYVARNNLRAMKKGDLAFFYHSNCKKPGIVGTMEIVQEHSPDLSAHDSKAPYYDAKSKPSDPKWSVVHVEFRSKFAQPIGLKELREMGSKPGSPLENMQMLKQSRLSVSRVTASEWDYLMRAVEERGGFSSNL